MWRQDHNYVTRSTRLGHIDFTSAVQHPLDAETELLCFPVVPADVVESTGGRQLPELYEELIESNQQNDVRHVSQTASAIVDLLTPVVVMLHAWNISPACNTLAHGIGVSGVEVVLHVQAADRIFGYQFRIFGFAENALSPRGFIVRQRRLRWCFIDIVFVASRVIDSI